MICEAVVELMDLAEDPAPVAELVIGIHPEVTKGGPWFRRYADVYVACDMQYIQVTSSC